MNSWSDELELVRRAKAGCARSFGELCEQHRIRVWRILATVAHGSDLEDLAQEAILRAWQRLKSYRGEAPFGAWLCRIAVNLAHDQRKTAWSRRVRTVDQLPDTPVPDHTSSEAEQRELQRRIRQAVAALPEQQRIPIWLHFFEGYGTTDIARLESTPESTVRSRIGAGLKTLGKGLQDFHPAADTRGTEVGLRGIVA